MEKIKIESEIEQLIYESEKIRNVAIYQGDNEITKAFARYTANKYEPAHSFIFDEMIMGPKADFSLQSVIQKHHDNNYLINLIDTPSLIIFNNFIQSIRVVDGIVIVVSARGVSENVEIVLKETLRYNIKPIIFINDFEYLINDLKLNPDEVQERLNNIVRTVNKFIAIYSFFDKKQEWQVDLNNGSVMFGSIYENLAFDIPFMNENGIGFEDIPNYFNNDNMEDLSKSPIFSVLNIRIIEHLPSPEDARTYRISKMWKGNSGSVEGPLSAIMIKNVLYNVPLAICRVYGGTLKKGDEIYIVESKGKFCVESVAYNIFPKGAIREIHNVPAGNIAYIKNVKDAPGFATVCLKENKIDEFKEDEINDNDIEIIAANIDLANNDQYALRKCSDYIANFKNIRTDLDYDSEKMTIYLSDVTFLLHLTEIFKDRYGINISSPRVIYKKYISSKVDNIKAISPNKQNILNFEIGPLDSGILNAFHEGDLKDSDFKTCDSFKNYRLTDEQLNEIDVNNNEMAKKFMAWGMDEKEANNVLCLHKSNMVLNMANDDNLNEMNDLIIDACKQALDDNLLASKDLSGVKIKLVDVKFHEDPVHRGPSQIMPAIKNAFNDAFKLADYYLMEPILKLSISTLTKYIEYCCNEIKNRRGILVNQEFCDDYCKMEFEVPVAEIFGFKKSFELITEGEGFVLVKFKDYEKLPDNLKEDTVNKILSLE